MIGSGKSCRVTWGLDAVNNIVGPNEAETEANMGRKGSKGLPRIPGAGSRTGAAV